MDLSALTAHELTELLKKKTVNPLDIKDSIISSVRGRDGVMNALANFDENVFAERARAVSEKKDSAFLQGIPVFIKDNIYGGAVGPVPESVER